MITRRAFGMGISATLLTHHAAAALQSFPAEGQATLAKLMDDRVLPGGFVAVGRGNQLLAFQPWGEASKSFRIPVSDRTLFHIGSVGKHITAAAILRLEQDGRISADRPIGSYVKGLPGLWADIPVRHLLSHTSGLPDYLSVLSDWDRPQPRATVLSAIGSLPLNFAPGEAFDYSNTGYLLLGWLINDVSGRSYPEYMRELLTDARAPFARLDAAGDIIENRAEPYTVEKGRLVHATRMESAVSAAADGGILMSARDVAPWNQALHGGRLVPAATLRRAFSPARLLTGRYAPYNYGFHLAQTRGERLHHHSGSGIGFMSHWAGLPDRSLAALVVTNYEGPNGLLLHEVAHAALEAVAPGSTYLSLPGQTADARSRALKALLERGDKDPDPAILAPELAGLGRRTRGVPRMREPIETLLPIESYEANGGEMVRYRIMQGGRAKHPLVGWTKEDQIFWIA